jgi:hypothetical protein
LRNPPGRIGDFISFRRGERKSFGWLAALTWFVFSYNAAACLEVAIINSLEIPRYLTVQFFFTLVAELLAAGLLLQTLGQLRSRPRLSAG